MSTSEWNVHILFIENRKFAQIISGKFYIPEVDFGCKLLAGMIKLNSYNALLCLKEKYKWNS